MGKLLKKLKDLYIPPSNFLVTPYIAYTYETPNFIINRREVAELIIIKMEELRDGLNSLVEQLNLQPQSRIRAFLLDAPNLNTSTHKNYQFYYSTELKQQIACADAVVIDQHNYMF